MQYPAIGKKVAAMPDKAVARAIFLQDLTAAKIRLIVWVFPVPPLASKAKICPCFCTTDSSTASYTSFCWSFPCGYSWLTFSLRFSESKFNSGLFPTGGKRLSSLWYNLPWVLYARLKPCCTCYKSQGKGIIVLPAKWQEQYPTLCHMIILFNLMCEGRGGGGVQGEVLKSLCHSDSRKKLSPLSILIAIFTYDIIVSKPMSFHSSINFVFIKFMSITC